MSKVSIRLATPADAATINQMILALATYEGEDDLFESSVEDLSAAFRDGLIGVLAFLDGQPVGYMLVYRRYRSYKGHWYLHLEDLFVSPEARGQKVGIGLLVWLAAYRRDRSELYGSHIDWHAARSNPACNFYDALEADRLEGHVEFRLGNDPLAHLEQCMPEGATLR